MKYFFAQFLFLATLLVTGTGFSQEVKIKKIELHEGDVILFYDLLDDNTDRRYTLRLYASLDNYIQPRENVEGDIGVDIAVGGNKKVIWHLREEVGENYSGELAIEIKGQPYIPFISLSDFESYGTFVRGRPYNITWTGGRGDNVLNFDLYNNDKKVHTFPNVANVGQYKIIIPENTKPGNNYIFRISDTKNRDEVIYTSPFKIKRKIPLGLKMFGGAVAATGIYFVLDVLLPEKVNTIPDPPDPPDQ